MTIDFDYVEKMTKGPIEIEELKFLAKYAEKVSDGGIIVNIGTSGGRSAFILAVASKPSVKIHTIDTKPDSKFFRDREQLKLENRVYFLKGKSQNLYKEWKIPLDLIFVDGDHSYEAVKEDVEGWCPFVKMGGFCLFHDYHGGPAGAGVKRAVDEAEGRIFRKLEVFQITYAGERIQEK